MWGNNEVVLAYAALGALSNARAHGTGGIGTRRNHLRKFLSAELQSWIADSYH